MDNHDHLIGVIVREAHAAGIDLTDDQAREYARRCLDGRDDIARPATWICARIRNHPEELDALNRSGTSPARRHPSGRAVRDVIGNYAERIAQVRAYYAEDDRRRAAGQPVQWHDHAAAGKAEAAAQAAASRQRRGVETVPLPDITDPDEWDAT